MAGGWGKVKKFGIWTVLMIIIAGSLYYGLVWYSNKDSKSAFTGKQVPVERGDMMAVVSATGTIVPVNMVNVSSKITGLIKEVRVNENDDVKTGQILIVLDDTKLKALVSQTEARLVNSAANHERMRQLNSIGAVSAQQLDAARMDYTVAKAAFEDAVSQLEDTVIKAPIDGKVIGKPIPAGQTVAPGISTPMVLLAIADMSKMQIETQIDESDIGKVAVGQKATFTVDAYPDKIFTGVVSNISNKANIQQNVVYYTVIIDVDAPEGLLKPSMTARVSVNVGESKNALMVPLTAVKESKGQRYVQILKDGKVQNINVTIGLASDDKVEILSGLSDGDQVVVGQPRQGQGAARNPLQRLLGR